MALVVEDGTGITGANSYCSVAFATSYFSDRGGTVWAAIATEAEQDQALIQATDYIEKRFGDKFIGEKDDHDNVLSWPRKWVYDRDGRLIYDATTIPLELKRATAEYAVRASVSSLMTDPTRAELEIEEKEVEAGPVKKRTKYMKGGSGNRQKSSLVRDSVFNEYPAADLLLEKLLGRSTTKQLLRV